MVRLRHADFIVGRFCQEVEGVEATEIFGCFSEQVLLCLSRTPKPKLENKVVSE